MKYREREKDKNTKKGKERKKEGQRQSKTEREGERHNRMEFLLNVGWEGTVVWFVVEVKQSTMWSMI